METGQCVHCGLCLSACPTYQETGLEPESPRGRVFLLAALPEHPELFETDAAQYLDDCLDCRACEEVCPAHVPTGHLVERWRAQEFHRPQLRALSSFRRFSRLSRPLGWFFGSPRGLVWFQRAVRWAKHPLGRAAIAWAVGAPSVVEGLPERIDRRLSRTSPTRPQPGRPRVMLFVGCVMDAVFSETNRHTLALIEWAGAEVVIPQDQRCCGALHLHGGQPEVARRWAQANIRAFDRTGAQKLIVNAAGCGALLKEYSQLFTPESPWWERAKQLSEQVVDATVFLAQAGLPQLANTGRTVTVQDPCHLAHAQGIRQEPRSLLQRAGYRVVEMADADRCCGSAGVYNLTHPVMAQRLLAKKVQDLPRDVEVVAAANPGCLIQIQSGLRQVGRAGRAAHPIDLVWQAYCEAGMIADDSPSERSPDAKGAAP